MEIGDLDNIDFKVKGFKEFAEKFLVYQDPQKYSKVSVKYNNQIVTTLNPYFEENDSILAVGNKELAKAPEIARKKADAEKAVVTSKPETKAKEKPKVTAKKPEAAKPKAPEKEKPKAAAKPKPAEKKAETKPKAKEPAKQATASKPKAKVKVE